MQVEDKEINGFLIENFNQHGLEVGKTQGICPLCSINRKPENQKAKCSSYDWERGIGTCHNCDKSYQLHTFKRKGKAEREYVVPEQTTVGQLDNKVVDWFKTRGISEQTLKDVKVGRYHSRHGDYMQQQPLHIQRGDDPPTCRSRAGDPWNPSGTGAY